jgi:hypothetical protein
MKTKISSGLLVILIVNALLLICPACRKKEIQGPKGEAGTPGGGGNAQISSTEPFIIGSSQWKATPDSSWKVTVLQPLLTADVVNKGGIKVFMQIGADWWELPHVDGDHFTQFSFTTGALTLEFSDMHGNFPKQPPARSYRLVILSEAAARQTGGNHSGNVNTNLRGS